MKIFILVPVYNEGKVFEQWFPGLLDLARSWNAEVVVIDDGSAAAVFAAEQQVVQQSSQVTILRHATNCGVGAALGTGLAFARSKGADVVLTIDGDGQHDPQDLKVLWKALQQGDVDIVNGSRFLQRQRIPLFRRFANRCANVVTFLLSGFWLTDSQSGMKGFSRRALQHLELVTPGYEWCTDVFREANWYGLAVKELPISVVYNSYTLSKGQNFAIGMDMVMRLMVRSLTR